MTNTETLNEQVIIRYWKPQPHQRLSSPKYRGHVSLQFPSRNNLYISFNYDDIRKRPEIITGLNEGADGAYARDIETIHRLKNDEDEKITVIGLDVDKMLALHETVYRSFRENQNVGKHICCGEGYRLFVSAESFLNVFVYEDTGDSGFEVTGSNCSHYAYYLLRRGGIEQLVMPLKISWRAWSFTQLVVNIFCTISIVAGIYLDDNNSAKKPLIYLGGSFAFLFLAFNIYLLGASFCRSLQGYGLFVTPAGIASLATQAQQNANSENGSMCCCLRQYRRHEDSNSRQDLEIGEATPILPSPLPKGYNLALTQT
jgi:hypothetical protein